MFHICILFLIDVVTCIYWGTYNHFKINIVKENLWRARKLFQCYLKFVFVPSIYEWCLSATICFMLCVPFYFVFIWFHFWLAVYWILVHREFVRLLKCECSFPPTQIRWKKPNYSRPQKFPKYTCNEIL